MKHWLAALVALVVVLLLAWLFVPAVLASGLPYTPPFPGERCADVYPTHVEFSGDAWCIDSSSLGCNGARCYHMGPAVHFCGHADLGPFSTEHAPVIHDWSVCGCF